MVPGAGLEPATFGCLRQEKGLWYVSISSLELPYESDAPPTTPPRQAVRPPYTPL